MPTDLRKSNTPASIAVVVCTRGDSQQLQRCLEALCAQAPDQLVVVQNGDFDAQLARRVRNMNALYLCENRAGLSRARNRGVLAASCDIVAFVDDDAEVQQGWADAMRAAFVDKEVGCVFGRVIDEGTENEQGRLLSAASSFLLPLREYTVLRPGEPCWFQEVVLGGLGIGCNFAVRRTELIAIGGFDERLGLGATVPGGEEHKAATDIGRRGYAVAHAPGAVALHCGWARGVHALRRRSVAATGAAAAYLLLLYFEYPDYRADVLAHVRRKVLGNSRELAAGLPLATRAAMFFSRFVGIARYLAAKIGSECRRRWSTAAADGAALRPGIAERPTGTES